ncbi:MAG: hypothetical protein CR994_03310 [Maribacter sp.]|nr:MAG: hypothetical protein CR994_03310 [Maribacter sp.]
MIVLGVFLIGATANVRSQDGTVEKSNNGIQIGVLGTWLHNEARLSDEIALRSELGLDSGFFGGEIYGDAGFIMVPVITLEPRWYYNLQKRAANSRPTLGNSGNFVSLKTSCHPDWFIISNSDNVDLVSQISAIPTWGIRRNIGKHFNYEAGIGIGFRYIFYKSEGFAENEGEAAANLHLRIGYRF